MQGFTQKIVQMMKSENLFQSQGGPIILSQVWCSCWMCGYFEENAFDIRILMSKSHFFLDWERIRTREQGDGSCWSCIPKLGCIYGCWIGNRSPLGDVQRNWCPRSYGEPSQALSLGSPFIIDLSSVEYDPPDSPLQINSCNGFYCDDFSPNKPYKPSMWTESWSGW